MWIKEYDAYYNRNTKCRLGWDNHIYYNLSRNPFQYMYNDVNLYFLVFFITSICRQRNVVSVRNIILSSNVLCQWILPSHKRNKRFYYIKFILIFKTTAVKSVSNACNVSNDSAFAQWSERKTSVLKHALSMVNFNWLKYGGNVCRFTVVSKRNY
jgi:hypothetical protein